MSSDVKLLLFLASWLVSWSFIFALATLAYVLSVANGWL